ncbi:MAG: alpha-E domain-containing protein [Nocardioidaceae bacterium]
MLSRIAESLFWIGRYVERAEDTARILDVQMQMMVEDPSVDIDGACRTLLSVMGTRIPDGRLTVESTLFRLAFDTDEGTSITAAVAGARESARRARETLSTDLWEVINSTYRFLPSGRFRAMRPQDAFRWVRERAAVINGTADATMSRDEGWQFLMLGRSLERADMTARLVATSALSPGSSSAWPTTLRACGAYQSFLRAYRGLETDREAAEYLLLDRLFPRSVVHALTRAEECLANLEASGQRVGFQDEAQRLLGRARAELEYRSITDITADLPGEMERLQRTCAAASDAVTHRYFAHAVAMSWQGGA